ncbi:uncharacterized protein LOC135473866 [Liolophura sinensis]|uniref:uncharacterized protein LOC135473866 n=1 Tax=Liolophura sinensis TaxID=3198878 RepID=UPI00315887C4
MSTESGKSRKAEDIEDGLSVVRIFYIVFGITVVLDFPAAVTFVVVGEISRRTCEVLAPVCLLAGGCVALTVYALLLLDRLLHRMKQKSGYAAMCANILQMIRIGCYLGAAFTMWLYWNMCSRELFYCAAIVAPICCCVILFQVYLISKL